MSELRESNPVICHFADRTQRPEVLKCPPRPGSITVVLVVYHQPWWTQLRSRAAFSTAAACLPWSRLSWASALADFAGASVAAHFRAGSRCRVLVPGPGDGELKPRSSNPCGETDTGLWCLSPRAPLGPAGETENVGWGLEEEGSQWFRARDADTVGEHLRAEDLSEV